MEDWIDYYDSAHTIYVSRRHRDVHFRLIAQDIIARIPHSDAVVLDYSCGEAFGADAIAARCASLILAEPAPGVRDRLTARFADNPKIAVVPLEGLSEVAPASVDLAVMNSVAQYMSATELEVALAVMRRMLRPSGKLVLGDVIPLDAGMLGDVWALLRFAARNGFLRDSVVGLARTAVSDYRQLRNRIGLQRYSEADMLERLRAAGFTARRAAKNLGHNPFRMTFEAQPAGN